MTDNDVNGWNVLSHINLITAMGAKFVIRLSQNELLKQRNVGNLVADIDR